MAEPIRQRWRRMKPLIQRMRSEIRGKRCWRPIGHRYFGSISCGTSAQSPLPLGASRGVIRTGPETCARAQRDEESAHHAAPKRVLPAMGDARFSSARPRAQKYEDASAVSIHAGMRGTVAGVWITGLPVAPAAGRAIRASPSAMLNPVPMRDTGRRRKYAGGGDFRQLRPVPLLLLPAYSLDGRARIATGVAGCQRDVG